MFVMLHIVNHPIPLSFKRQHVLTCPSQIWCGLEVRLGFLDTPSAAETFFANI